MDVSAMRDDSTLPRRSAHRHCARAASPGSGAGQTRKFTLRKNFAAIAAGNAPRTASPGRNARISAD